MSDGGCGNCLQVAQVRLADKTVVDVFVCDGEMIRVRETAGDGTVTDAGGEVFDLQISAAEGQVKIDLGTRDRSETLEDVPASFVRVNGKLVQGHGVDNAVSQAELERRL